MGLRTTGDTFWGPSPFRRSAILFWAKRAVREAIRYASACTRPRDLWGYQFLPRPPWLKRSKREEKKKGHRGISPRGGPNFLLGGFYSDGITSSLSEPAPDRGPLRITPETLTTSNVLVDSHFSEWGKPGPGAAISHQRLSKVESGRERNKPLPPADRTRRLFRSEGK